MDPFPSSVIEGQWSTIRGAKELVFMGGDRLLEWEPQSGKFRLWQYDHSYSQRDPLPGSPVAEGQWSSIRAGHELTYIFEDRLLDFEPASGHFRVWRFDRNNRTDPIPDLTAEGSWSSIRSGHKLLCIDGDQVLDFEAATGSYRVWGIDRNNRGEVFPGAPVVQGQWSSIRHGHELVYLSKDRLLDWEPASGNYRVWAVDRRGSQGDLLPGSPTAQGTWSTIRGNRRLVRVSEEQVLDWEPESGRYRVWRVNV